MTVVFSAAGLRALRFAWATLGLGIAAASLLAWATHAYLESQSLGLAQTRQQLAQAQSRLGLARRARDDLAASAATYHQLSAGGALRPEDRLEFVERLATLRATHRLATLEYAIDAQRKVAVAGMPTSAVQLSASHVRLTLRALHEGDALAFLRDAARPPTGFLPTADCALRRLDGTGAEARVEASCHLEWVSILDPQGGRAR